MRLRVAAFALVAVLGLAGCGSDRGQISDKVHQLAQAVGSHDYNAICDQVLAPSLVNRLVGNGIPCVQALQLALQGVQQPVISIGRIDIQGSQATAITLTVARGQQASLAAIKLIKTSQGWRITSLGSPLSGTAGSSGRTQ
jgi:hypothetical protein